MKFRNWVAGAMFLYSSVVNANVYFDIAANQFVGVDDFDNEQSFAVSVGYELSDTHRIELEYQINGFDSTAPGFEVDADVVTYLLNYDYTAWSSGETRFYFGGGYGWSEPEFKTSLSSQGDDSISVYNLHVGGEYRFSERFGVLGEIRYQDFEEFSDGGVEFDVGAPVMIGVSLRYRF